jgi:hypothetical protein
MATMNTKGCNLESPKSLHFLDLIFFLLWNTTAFLDILRGLKRHNSTLLGSLGWGNSKNMGPTCPFQVPTFQNTN